MRDESGSAPSLAQQGSRAQSLKSLKLLKLLNAEHWLDKAADGGVEEPRKSSLRKERGQNVSGYISWT